MAFDTVPRATSDNSHARKDAKRAFGIGVATVVAQGATAIAAVILARTGGPTAFGQVTIILALSALASDVLDWGVSAGITRAVAAGRLKPSRAGRLLIARAMVLVLAAGALAAVSSPWLSETARIADVYPVAFITVLGVNAALKGAGKFGIASLCIAGERILMIIVFLVLIFHHVTSGLAFVLSMVVGSVSVSALGLIVLLQAGGAQGEGWFRELAHLYRSSKHLGLGSLATDLSVIDSALVSAVAGLAVAGEYGAASRVTGPLGIPASSLAAVMLPRLSSTSNARVAWETVASYRKEALALLAFLAALALSAPVTVPAVLGSRFTFATVIGFQMMCFSVWFGSLNQILYVFLQARHMERWGSVAILLSVGVTLAATTLGALFLGTVGATLGALAGQVVLAILLFAKAGTAADVPAPAGLESQS